MAREKGTGNLQKEKSGRWTIRVGINGKRYSRSTRTCDKDQAERYLERFLNPFGLGKMRLPLSDVWLAYLKSPCRRDLAKSTLESKRNVWQHFAKWMEKNYLHVTTLSEITREMVAEYLRSISLEICASTYNARLCVLREIFHCLADNTSDADDPWAGVRLRTDDSHSRRELTLDELSRLIKAAADRGREWHRLFLVGIYTGMRLGDCCRLAWDAVNLERRVIQIVPQKTQKHSNGHPVTIPIHDELLQELNCAKAEGGVSVMPMLAQNYKFAKWHVAHGLQEIFKAANIQTSVRLDGRRMKTPEATFHSLRHTFVSFAANAGISLSVIAAIVGHSSTAMTRHYYHENEEVLRRAVNAIPSIGSGAVAARAAVANDPQPMSVEKRLKQLERLYKKNLVSRDEYNSTRTRILSEI